MNAAPGLDANARAARVRLMIFDVDGVLTDGGLLFTGAGDTMKGFNSLDGHGAKLLREAGIDTAIITGRRSEIVALRAKELRITHLYQGVEDKRVAFEALLAETGITREQCGYMGDDWPDLGVMLQCGFGAAPANAHPDVLARAHWVTDKIGGHGAVREVTDLILRAQGHYDAMLAAACSPGTPLAAESRAESQ
ncbi:3-deoxy-D-manno-octulosonate 8-phosphate phosphatase KdsC [Paraburkholderia sacchari]|uniref:KdsC family phosphatase n=1 Tax=Paraburkholderia sacchari TaxID=159450 RepID=UPI0039A64EDD